MSVYRASSQISSRQPAITADGAKDLVAVQSVFTLSGALGLNNVIEMMVLPAGHKLVDAILESTDLDTGGSPAITLSVGTMAGTPYDPTFASRGVTANVIAASTIGQAGGVARAAVAGFSTIAGQDTDRSIGVLVAAGPATGAATGTISLTIMYRPIVHGQ
ncbi:MAG: hypothetical protein ACK5XA_15775 [Tagaea sp.]